VSSFNMAEFQQEIELGRLHNSSRGNANSHRTQQQVTTDEIEHTMLPPTDRGKEAWLVLAGCSLIQIPVWGN